jgi:hypothetical protein
MDKFRIKTLTLFLLSLHMVLVLVRPISDPDVWWHLRTGQYIVQTKTVPRADLYSYTVFGKRWIAHEWLSEVAMYSFYHLLGWVGLTVIVAVVSAAVFLYLAHHCQAAFDVVIVSILFSHTAALVVLREPRPRLASLILGTVFLVTIREFVRTRRHNMLWLLPPLMILWVNLHAGYPLGFIFMMIGLMVLLAEKDRGNAKRIAMILGLCGIAVLINPNGLRMWSYPFETQFSAVQMLVISEWNAPNFRQPQALPFLFLILAVVVALGLSRKRISGFDLFALIIALVMSLRAYRHVSVFAAVATPVLAEHLSDWLSSEAKVHRILENFMPVILAVVLTVDLATSYGTITHPVKLSDFPVAATKTLEQQQLPDNVFSTYEWNDYLIWNAPSRKVFIDGRADMYGDDFLMGFFRLYSQGEGWQGRFNQFNVNTVMIEPSSRLAELMKESPVWSQVYDDGQALIFVRKTGNNRP